MPLFARTSMMTSPINVFCCMVTAFALLSHTVDASHTNTRFMLTFKDGYSACARGEVTPPCTRKVKCYNGRLLVDLQACLITGLDEAEAWAHNLYGRASLASVEQDTMMNAHALPYEVTNPMAYPTRSWPMQGRFGMNVASKWEQGVHGSEDVVVAIVDTGLREPVMSDVLDNIVDGYDFVTLDGDDRDPDYSDPGPDNTRCGAQKSSVAYHGSLMASIVASANPALPGVAKGVSLMSVRVLDGCGFGSSSDLADGVAYSTGQPINGLENNPFQAKIVSLSVSGPGACPSYLQTVITKAVLQKGATVIVAAGNGNHGRVDDYFPANCEHVVIVGASTIDGHVPFYCNLGFHLAAPGGERRNPVTVLGPNDREGETLAFRSVFGTSVSAAMASGYYALGLASSTPAQPFYLGHSVIPWPSNCSLARCGAGILSFGHESNAVPVVVQNVEGVYRCGDGAKLVAYNEIASPSSVHAEDTFMYMENGIWKKKTVPCTGYNERSFVLSPTVTSEANVIAMSCPSA